MLFRKTLSRFDKVGNIPLESSRPTNHQRGIFHTDVDTSKLIICFLLFGYKSSNYPKLLNGMNEELDANQYAGMRYKIRKAKQPFTDYLAFVGTIGLEPMTSAM